jgi:CPA2 family monovalent cation:H+ antiporter-2
MEHNVALISTIAAGMGLALVLGFIAVRLKLPALVGYLVAGILVGPFSPGFVADVELAHQLSEIGVMLLMFGVGLHFSLEDLWSVRKIALPGAIAQIAVATGLGAGVAALWGWNLGAGIVFGLALSVASTVVLIKALEARGVLETMNGRIAVGWLVVEDLVLVLMLVLLPPLATALGAGGPEASGGDTLRLLAVTLGKVALFIGLMLVVGRRLFPWVLWQVARLGSRELFTLCVIAAAVSLAYAAGVLFGVSFALGAFFAGMVLRGSDLSYRAAEESLPLRDAFSVLFFVAVGMIFDPTVLVRDPLKVLVVVAIIVLGKSLAAFVIVILFRYPLNTALTVSASLAQIGEFSFILAGLGASLGLLPLEAQSLILAGAIISIALNPLVFDAIEPACAWIRARSRLARFVDRTNDPLSRLPDTVESGHVTGRGVGVVVVEQNREAVERLRARGIKAVAGVASDPAVLVQAHVARAGTLLLAVPDMIQVRQAVEIAQTLNPGIEVIARTHSQEDSDFLLKARVGGVFLGEHELAASMAAHAFERMNARAQGHAPSAGH